MVDGQRSGGWVHGVYVGAVDLLLRVVLRGGLTQFGIRLSVKVLLWLAVWVVACKLRRICAVLVEFSLGWLRQRLLWLHVGLLWLHVGLLWLAVGLLWLAIGLLWLAVGVERLLNRLWLWGV